MLLAYLPFLINNKAIISRLRMLRLRGSLLDR